MVMWLIEEFVLERCREAATAGRKLPKRTKKLRRQLIPALLEADGEALSHGRTAGGPHGVGASCVGGDAVGVAHRRRLGKSDCKIRVSRTDRGKSARLVEVGKVISNFNCELLGGKLLSGVPGSLWVVFH